MMAFSSVIEPLRAANVLARRQCYRWSTVGLSGDKVEASSGVAFEPDYSVHDAPVVDRIVVCSGGDADHLVADHAVAWIRRNLRAGAHLGAVADAAFFLARAGLLDGHACTLHWTSQPAFVEAFPEIELRRDLYVIDRKRFTSAGGVGSLDMMLEIIAKDCGTELAAGVAEWFVHSPLRSSVDRKMMPLRLRTGIQNELVLSAVAVMEEAVEERLRMADLAAKLGVSADKLERLFRSQVESRQAPITAGCACAGPPICLPIRACRCARSRSPAASPTCRALPGRSGGSKASRRAPPVGAEGEPAHRVAESRTVVAENGTTRRSRTPMLFAQEEARAPLATAVGGKFQCRWQRRISSRSMSLFRGWSTS